MATLARSLTFTSLVVAFLGAAGCTLQEQSMPPLAGPSGLALDVVLSASPEFLPRDGVSNSIITITLRDHEGKPVPRRALRLSVASSPGVGGKLQASEAETDANGRVAVVFTAPGVNEDVDDVYIGATPLTGNVDTALTHSVRIRVFGPSLPVPAFTFLPAAPAQFELVAFDATGTTVGGAACTACTYSWAFGSESTGSGSFTQYRFQQRQSYDVKLTVTMANGTSAQLTKVVTVGAPARPTASFVVSPTNPRVGETVHFNASGSTSPSGTTITRYHWNFGNGEEDTTSEPTTDIVYDVARTYTVTLTVEDSNGQMSTIVSTTVAVAVP